MNLGGTVHINKTGCCILVGCLVIFFLYLFTNRNVSAPGVIVKEINLNKLIAVAIEAAENGGKEVVATRNDLVIESKGKTKEGANDSVTTADFRSHCVMMWTLKRRFPTLTVISEESKTVCDDKYSDYNDSEVLNHEFSDEFVPENDVKVWIDPLDATQEYTEKLYKYVTTMVCVAVRGYPVIGVIHKPFEKVTSWAWRGRGVSEDLLQPQGIARSDKLRFIVSRSHTGAAKEVIQKLFKPKNIEIISAGGAGYKVLEVANGNADVYVHITAIKKWDVCAGNAVLNALGGAMTTKYDTQINYTDSDNPVNEDGIVGTLRNHHFFLDKL